jgi:hypothetical protein
LFVTGGDEDLNLLLHLGCHGGGHWIDLVSRYRVPVACSGWTIRGG